MEQTNDVIHLDVTASEDAFLLSAFKMLSKSELEDLVKISVCMIAPSDDVKLPHFLERINGKFYFNPEFNRDDPEVVAWYEFKKDYVAALPHSRCKCF